jgi:hypothetical protein
MKDINVLLESMAGESYLDITTLINTVKNVALKDLGLNNETTPFIIDHNLDLPYYGRTNHGLGGLISYVAINDKQDIMNMIKTIFHESRHIYQIRKYREYMDNYVIKNLAGLGPKTYLQYYWQPVEVGARVYAWFAMKKHKKQIRQIIKQYVNNELQEQLY